MKIRTLTIMLNHDVGEEDARGFASLLRMLGPVADVELGPSLDIAHWQAVVEAREALGKQIAALISGRNPTDS